MAESPGISYELLTREIFDLLQNQGSVTTVDVQHNVVLKGKTTDHQIDVYWEFEFGGIVHPVVVQAKDWGSPAKKAHLLTLKAVLDDLPRRPRGIVVTRFGFQKGAKEFASGNGIDIFQLKRREGPKLNFPAGSIITFHARGTDAGERVRCINDGEAEILCTAYSPYLADWRCECDQPWVDELYKDFGRRLFDELRTLSIPASLDIELCDESGNPTTKLRQVWWPLIKEMQMHGTLSKAVTKVFEASTYIHSPSELVPLVKIRSMSGTLALLEEEVGVVPMHLQGFTPFVLRNVLDGIEWSIAIPEGTIPPGASG
jgi:hypothetical protein